MNPANYVTKAYLNKNIQYIAIRYVRGGITIKLKEPKAKEKIRRPFESNQALFRKNEGINHRLRMFIEDGELKENDLSDIDIDDLEPDVQNFGTAYNEHFKEMEKLDKTKHYFYVLRKHYKSEKLPNMLTYGEKAQIRRLNLEDPELWTSEKLAENFPASPTIIKKIIKSKWMPKSKNQVLSHDKTVENNWKLFRQNKLKFDENLHKHISKFTDRHSIVYTEAEIENFITKSSVRPKAAEFGEIIESYKRMTKPPDNRKQIEDGPIHVSDEDCNRVYFKQLSSKFHKSDKSITLDEFRGRLEQKKKKDPVDRLILGEKSAKDISSNTSANTSAATNEDDDFRFDGIESYSFNTKALISKRGIPNYLQDNIVLRIEIPDHLFKKGKTYRVKDCFYDDNGTFLYRVPGFTG